MIEDVLRTKEVKVAGYKLLVLKDTVTGEKYYSITQIGNELGTQTTLWIFKNCVKTQYVRDGHRFQRLADVVNYLNHVNSRQSRKILRNLGH